jgi:hypothetical protein
MRKPCCSATRARGFYRRLPDFSVALVRASVLTRTIRSGRKSQISTDLNHLSDVEPLLSQVRFVRMLSISIGVVEIVLL